MRTADLSQKFQEVLAGYLEARERGERVDRDALVRAHPELAAELDEYFANEQQLGLAAGLSAAGGTRAGQRIGEYEVVGEIARGGMGVVYRARHRALGRMVALKMMLGGEFAGRDGLRRFHEEAKHVARLDHPNIVPIYEVGAHAGQAFFAMKLIEGPSLKQEIAWYVDKPKEAARLIIQVARAVHHAHQRGILHRDLKPGNILLQIADFKAQTAKAKKDYPVAGVPQSAIDNLKSALPYVTDFGLAKRIAADGQASQSTAVVGTAAYMAPEQATGKEALSVAADVYSLGAILYELLTGQKPFTGENPMEVLLKVVNEEPKSPLELQPALDADLARICLKCLRKQPQERYASAEALAEELLHWLEGDALSVRAPTLAERATRWSRRHPLALGLIGAILLGVAGLGGLTWHLGNLNAELANALEETAQGRQLLNEQEIASERSARIAAERAKAEIEQLAADREKEQAARFAALKESRRLLVRHYVNNGEQLLQRGDAFASAIWFAKALEHDPDDPTHRLRLGAVLRQCPPLERMWSLDGKVRLLRLSPTGERILIGVKNDEAALFDAQSGRQLGQSIRHEGGLAAAEFSPDGQYLATAGADGSARLFLAETGLPHLSVKHPQKIHAVAFSSDSSKLATGSADKTARVWNVANAKEIGKHFDHPQEVRIVAFHPDGKKLLAVCEGSKKGELHVWDLTTHGAYFKPWPERGKKDKSDVKSIIDAGFSRDGRRLYAIASSRRVYLWKIEPGSKQDGDAINVPASLSAKGDVSNWFSPGLDRILAISESDVKIVDLPTAAVAQVVHQGTPVESAQFSPAGRFVAVTGLGGGVRLFRADTGQPFCPPLPNGAKIVAISFSHNDQRLAIAGDDRIVRLWNLAWPDRPRTGVLPKARGPLYSGSPDGRFGLFMQGKSLAFWDMEQGRTVGAAMSMPTTGPILTRWAADGSGLAIAVGGETRLFEVPSGKPIAPSKDLAVWASKMQDAKQGKGVRLLDCDGRRLALCKAKGTLEIHDVSGESAKTVKVPVAPDVLRFSPDRHHAAAGFADGALRIFTVADGKPASPPLFFGEPIRHIAYSGDGKLLAAGSARGRVRVWESATGQPLSGDFFAAGPFIELFFRADNEALCAWSESRVQRFSLAPITDTPAELLLQARRAAAQDIDPASGALVPLDAISLKELWQAP